MSTISIHVDDLESEATRDLLRLHLAGMQAHTPVGHVHALDLSGLKAPNVTVWTAWEGEHIAGIGALKVHEAASGSAAYGEIKSMRTHPDFLHRGVGSRMLDHIIAEARRRELSHLALETGSGAAFDAAIRLYRRRGFNEGDAFADYAKSAFNRFFHLDIR